jgi:TPR repeat protein
LDKSKSHDPDYLYQLGCAFTYGKGLPFDHFKAFELFKKASEKGHGRAQLMLGFMYLRNGDLLLGDWGSDYQFVKWIKKAAENGVLEAQREIEEYQWLIKNVEGEG